MDTQSFNNQGAPEKGPISECELSRQRMTSIRNEVILLADWEEALFLQFKIEPSRVAALVPAPLELDLFGGDAIISLVTLTMRRFRPARIGSLGWLLTPVSQERVMNLRTCVKRGQERGAFFIWGWLSRPWNVPWPAGLFHMPYSFASLQFDQEKKSGQLCRRIRSGEGQFEFVAQTPTGVAWEPCPQSSLAEFAMERYAGFFRRKTELRSFWIWHEPWKQKAVEISIERSSLIASKLPWFGDAVLTGSFLAEGLRNVWLGRMHETEELLSRSHRLSSFYEMP